MTNLPELPSALQSSLPIFGAPMAGGVSTVELVEAVASAGGLGFLPLGYANVAVFEEKVEALRSSGVPHGLNIFAPGQPGDSGSAAKYRAYAQQLAPLLEDWDLDVLWEPKAGPDQWEETSSFLLDYAPNVVSFTFGLPPGDLVRDLQKRGTTVALTVTTLEEATEAARAGADALIVQGPEAGGHSGTWDPHRRIRHLPTHQVVRSLASQVRLPVIAAGGVAGPRDVKILMEAGAQAVAVGTALMRSDEAGASQVVKDALVSDAFNGTTIGRSYTGRPARSLRNLFTETYGPSAPVAYPEIHYLTVGLRAEAAKKRDADYMGVWAGTGHRFARAGSAQEIVEWLNDF